ncbi:MAG: alpha/beta fold hydrolase [Nitriliruptorales bacterium]|nr:alpha/beta fold hydrolase [Nitriliruptorales bacterium]
MAADAVVAAHERRGRRFRAADVGSFVLDEGDGDPVVCMHGVPASSFLYRKVLRELAARGLRGVAFDLPGLGLAERPEDFDYSWTGLGRWAVAAVDALELERFHLVVHDIGGPVGFELGAALPDRVASLTILNTMIDVGSFRKPWIMRPFGVPGLGRAWLEGSRGPAFRGLLRWQGINDQSAVSNDELDAYRLLVRGPDNGRAFLRIMQSFETTVEKTRLYTSIVSGLPCPVQVAWGEHDPALTFDHHGRLAQQITGVETVHRLPGKHFLQEDCAPAIADLVTELTGSTDQR